ncbi:MAG: cytochrome P450 [Planctomycetota bacterium]
MIFELLNSRTMAPFAGVPGPKPIFPFGNLLDFVGKTKRPWEVFASYGNRYGGMSLTWMFNYPSIVLNDAKLIEQILISRTKDFYKDEPCGALIPVLTRSSPNILNGEEWTDARTQSPFMQSWAIEWQRAQLPHVRQRLRQSAEHLATASSAEPIPLQLDLQRTTFDAFSIATMGRELPDAAYKDFIALATLGSNRMLAPWRPSKDLNAAGQSLQKRFQQTLRDYCSEAKNQGAEHPFDLLSLTLQHHSQIPPEALASEMGNVFYGGCFSVPSTLVSTLYLLNQNPHEKVRLVQAIDALGPDFDCDSLLACKPLDYALREGMRLLPAVPLFSRRVLPNTSTELGGIHLPPNTNIWICHWLLQRSSPHWDDPLTYTPDRWGGGIAESNPLGSDYFAPEGRGPRMCLGADYSIFYMKLVLATWLSEWEIDCGRGQPYDAGQDFFFGVRMPWGLKASFRKR